MELELFYDYGSTYSYPAVMTADAIAAKRGLLLVHRPFLLGPIFAAQGYTTSPFNAFPTKGKYMQRDLERICGELGLGWKWPSVFPRKGVLASRITLVGLDEDWGKEFSRRVYTQVFQEDRDIEDEALMRSLLVELGQDADAVLERALSQPNRDRLRAQTTRAQELGIFGAPTFVVGEELFWGHDRMQQALAWAEKGAS